MNTLKDRQPRIVLALALALLLASTSAFAQRPARSTTIKAAGQASASSDEQAVRAVLLLSADAFARGDLATLNRVWANDEALTVFEQGSANYGWADYRDHHLVPEMGEMKNTKYTLSDIRVHTAGQTAWATFKYTISADVERRHVDGGGLGTAILEARQGRWQIVHWHSSAPRHAPAKKSD